MSKQCQAFLNGGFMVYKIDSFSVDKNYLHIIQNVSRDHTEEIYSYLYESAISIIEDFFSKKKLPKRLNRKNTFFYKKNSTLPVTIEVHSWVEYSIREGSTPGVHIMIKFPVIHQNMNVKQIQEIYEEKLEKSLGLTDKVTNLVNFDLPTTKINKNLRKIF